jgi:hypothetical protein
MNAIIKIKYRVRLGIVIKEFANWLWWLKRNSFIIILMNHDLRTGRPADWEDHVAYMRRKIDRLFTFVPDDKWWAMRIEVDAFLKHCWAEYRVEDRMPQCLVDWGPGSLSEEEPKRRRGRPKKK